MQTDSIEAQETRYAELQQLALDYARNNDTESLSAMLQHGLAANLRDLKGNSLLMLATYYGNVETTQMLLEYGANVNLPNDRGQTPLGGAAFKGHEEIVTLLLAHGADADADNGTGMTPIMFAAMFGRIRVVALLRQHGASLQHRNCIGLSARLIFGFSVWVTGVVARRVPLRPQATSSNRYENSLL